MYEVIVLKEGYSIKEGQGQQKACGTITLLKGPHNIIVDTGNPWDKDLIIKGLCYMGLSPADISYVVCTNAQSDKVGNLNLFDNATCIVARGINRGDHYLCHGFAEHELTPDKIEYAVCTHGHSDHVGNLNLFTNAIHIVSHDICVGDTYMLHAFDKGIPYEIDDNVEVVSTPGHTSSDVSVIVNNTKYGIVAVTGDLFEREEDLEDFSMWQECSDNPEIQQQYRMEILRQADYIVPGHGPMFKVPDEYKKQMHMVMYYESSSVTTVDGKTEKSESRSCIVMEQE